MRLILCSMYGLWVLLPLWNETSIAVVDGVPASNVCGCVVGAISLTRGMERYITFIFLFLIMDGNNCSKKKGWKHSLVCFFLGKLVDSKDVIGYFELISSSLLKINGHFCCYSFIA